jgi:phosphoglycolate phosphatase
MRTLLFDFDGTLADSFGIVVEIFYELTGHERIEDSATIAHLRHLPLMQVTKELHISPIQIPRLLIKGRRMMSDQIDQVQAFEGIADMLKVLHEHGHKMYVMSSNSTHNVEAFLRSNKLDNYFAGVYGGIGLLNKTAAIKKVMRQVGLSPESCVYVGDEARDVDGAKRAGVHMIAVGWGYNDPELLKAHNPDNVVYHPKDIITEVEKV